MTTPGVTGLAWRDASLKRLELLRGWIDGALEQLSDEELRQPPGRGLNSVAIVVKHLSGSMRSRFSDFLTSDGEKPWRQREREFIDDYASCEAMLADWRDAWAVATGAIAGLSESDLGRIVTIRSEPHTVADAITRFVAHVGYHAGQILMIGRMLRGERWRYQTIAPGESGAYLQSLRERFGGAETAERSGPEPRQ